MPNKLLDMDTVIPEKQMTEEEIKLQYITPAIAKSGWNSEQWICKELAEL